MSTEVQNHDAWLESAALYVIDAMTAEERRAFESHLRSCAECQAEVASLEGVDEALASAVPQIDPPAALRDRVMAGIRPKAEPRGAADTLARADATQRTLQATQSHLDVLTAPDSTRVALAGQAPAPGASGRADWSRARGLAVSLENLPPLQPGRTYQVWLLTAGMPVSAGLLTPDAAGRSTGVYAVPQAGVMPTGIALTEEPEGGLPQPTGQPILVGLLGRAG